MAGIGERPLSSSAEPVSGPNVEYNFGDPENNPISNLSILPSKVEIEAGFHCNAPEISKGCPVEAPPIDMLKAPTPCMICPVWANIVKEDKNKQNVKK